MKLYELTDPDLPRELHLLRDIFLVRTKLPNETGLEFARRIAKGIRRKDGNSTN